MKTTLLLFALWSSIATAEAAIFRVNNTGVPGTYTTFSAAHGDASDGDTIHVEASMFTYGSHFITKQLVVIGPGFFLGENAMTQLNFPSATFNWFSFGNGGEGTVVSGITFTQSMHINRSNVRFERCRFTGPFGLYGNPLNSIQIIGCHIEGDFSIQSGVAVSNITIANNIFTGTLTQGGSATGEFVNNTISNTSTESVFSLNGLVVRNNIFDCEVTPGGNVFMNNLFRTAPIAATNGNQINVPMGGMFIGGTVDNQWQHAPGSAAVGAGDNGEDAGAFGGNEPYRLSGVPAVPSVFGLTVPATIELDAPLPITMSARTNN